MILLPGCNAIADPDWPLTNFDRITVDPAEIVPGGPPKDGIPSMDNPVFTSASFADQWLNAKERVIGVIKNVRARVCYLFMAVLSA